MKNNHLAQLGLTSNHSTELLKALHILTRDGQINQDSRRKLKQVQHLLQFIKPLLLQSTESTLNVLDYGSGKSYLGFLMADWLAQALKDQQKTLRIIGIERREDLVKTTLQLAAEFNLPQVSAIAMDAGDSTLDSRLPERVDLVTALHACDTATDDAIAFALQRRAEHVVIVPCCQALVASQLRAHKALALKTNPLSELWRHGHHTREFGSQLTNVLRCLQLQAHGYQVSVTELIGWEHSMKNELIIASKNADVAKRQAAQRLEALLAEFGLNQDDEIKRRYFLPPI